MRLKTRARDCLYLNWAFPKEAAPALPETLRYETHRLAGEDWVFASALLFRLSGLHPEGLPFLRLSYPQMSVRLYVRDADDLPAVLFVRLLVPAWIAPVVRWIGRQPAEPALLRYASPSSDPAAESWSWRIDRPRRAFEIEARRAEPLIGAGPDLGSWESTLAYFRSRQRGYAIWGDRLRRLATFRPPVEVWPLQVDLHDTELFDALLPGARPEMLHSAWLCGEIPFAFEVGPARRLRIVPHAEAATAMTHFLSTRLR